MISPTATRLKLIVVPHTHWDREWYLPFEQFRLKLVRLVDRLLAIFESDPRYTHFMLDGQTIVLEDYLEIRPEQADRLRELISDGRIAVGPWYVLPDEFLVSGEALVRNLQIGMAIARRFGQSMEIGYLPDSFGHLAQMPQIFRGFGFDTGCLWRGVGDDNPGTEWIWESPDGSSIYLQWLAGGYGNFGNLPEDVEAAGDRLKAEVERIGKLSKARTYLLMNGSDHLMPQPFLPDHIAAFNAANPDWEVVQGKLAEAIALSRSQAGALPTIYGELRQAADTSLLPGVLSARSYLKLENAHAQTLLERWTEPMTALAWLAGAEHPSAPLRHAWKLLLQNHPHDSICGCSVDSVHRQMMTRFEQVRQLGGTLCQEAFATLQGEDPEADLPRQQALRLYNPHPWPHIASIETELTLDCPADAEPVFRLIDEEGQPVAFEVRSFERGVRVVNRSPEYPYNVAVARTTIRLCAELPAFGYRTLRIEHEPGSHAQHPELYAGDGWIENRFFKVRATDGGIEIYDKSLEETIVHTFEDRGDRGDEYNYCPVEGEMPLVSREWPWKTIDIAVNGHSARLRLGSSWALPAGLAADRSRREGQAPFDIRMEVSLHAGVRRVEIETEVLNRSKDHRLRACFKTPAPITHTHADTAFGWVHRSSAIPVKDWAEKPMGTFPMVSQVAIEGPHGLAGIAAAGLHEYEASDESLFLTLIRAVGWLSREDLSTRKGDAGPMLASPEAQCLGSITFRYAWTSQDSDEPEGSLERRGQEFTVQALAYPTAEWKGYHQASFLRIDQPAWQFSALKRSDSGDRLVLRVFNTSPRPQAGVIDLGFPVKGVSKARLDETPLEPLALEGQSIRTTLGGFAIATFLLEV